MALFCYVSLQGEPCVEPLSSVSLFLYAIFYSFLLLYPPPFSPCYLSIHFHTSLIIHHFAFSFAQNLTWPDRSPFLFLSPLLFPALTVPFIQMRTALAREHMQHPGTFPRSPAPGTLSPTCMYSPQAQVETKTTSHLVSSRLL
ncbi:hypothetical protein B0I35DRAFT_444630 [Stachybotrys elegans]|uniref:Uncharacterized protein n=1 Tax=Stachybotrys elegans TaxID=80388 RepID=A0A8K0SG71_9HYPO|nr:hypothetical protein B0I35DRAFT_444630 [Stachybotrys elegans]